MMRSQTSSAVWNRAWRTWRYCTHHLGWSDIRLQSEARVQHVCDTMVLWTWHSAHAVLVCLTGWSESLSVNWFLPYWPLQGNSSRVQEDLETEFSSLHSVLDELKDSMVTRIKQERASRTYELQVSSTLLGFYWRRVLQAFALHFLELSRFRHQHSTLEQYFDDFSRLSDHKISLWSM